MNPIHIQILTLNNEQGIQRCLSSLNSLPADISIYDMGSTDQTVEIAQKYGTIYRIPNSLNRAETRNTIVHRHDQEWQMYLNPWETLTDSATCLEGIKTASPYFHFMILQNQSIMKEVRLWRRDANLKFENYAFESISVAQANILGCMVHSSGFSQDYQENLTAWSRDKPTAAEPIYYRACQHLINKQWSEFIVMANHYLILETKAKMPVVMTKYYLAAIYLHVKKDYQMAIKHLLEIISVKPLMAEFWCLLGDVYYKMQEYERARHLYENGMVLARKRATDDLWPLEINKYKTYPASMIHSCEQVEKHTVYKKSTA